MLTAPSINHPVSKPNSPFRAKTSRIKRTPLCTCDNSALRQSGDIGGGSGESGGIWRVLALEFVIAGLDPAIHPF
jgi:hypothetical protein